MLADIPSGSRVFIDSNIFIYHFLDLSEICTSFLERIGAHEIRGFTSEVVMAEVLHKLMVAEIASDLPPLIDHIDLQSILEGLSFA